DGARHWKKEFHSSWLADPGARLVFFDRRHGFVYPAGPGLVDLYRTVDGGAHWTHPALPHVLVGEITFADANDGWILSDASGGDGSLPTQLFATVDGGDSWFQQPDAPQSASGAMAMRSRT